MAKITLPVPDCPLGYPTAQLHELLGDDQWRFWEWMKGQTFVICDGRRYSYEAKAHEPSECSGHAHGDVVFAHDVARFTAGKEPLD